MDMTQEKLDNIEYVMALPWLLQREKSAFELGVHKQFINI
jgi:hypothetical protein